MADAMACADAIAARRSEPGVCAVPRSNSSGLTILIAAEDLMASRSIVVFNLEVKQRWIGELLNWSLVVRVELTDALTEGASVNLPHQKPNPLPRCQANYPNRAGLYALALWEVFWTPGLDTGGHREELHPRAEERRSHRHDFRLVLGEFCDSSLTDV